MFQGMDYVYAVYKEKSFSQAAKKLFISQPALSATVKRLERSIGYPLFDRSTKPLRLTECGQKYIELAEQIYAQEREFTAYVNDWKELKTGQLVLGGSSFFCSWVLPALMREFARRFPQVRLAVVEETTVKLRQQLLAGSIDLLIDNGMQEQNLFSYARYQQEHLVLVVPRHLAVNKQLAAYQLTAAGIRSGAFLAPTVPAVPLAAFRDEAFNILKQENDTRRRAVEICQANGFTPRILFELDQQLTSFNITSSGLGISFIGASLVAKVQAAPAVVYYKLDPEKSSREAFFCWKKGRYVTRAMTEFLALAIPEPPAEGERADA